MKQIQSAFLSVKKINDNRIKIKKSRERFKREAVIFGLFMPSEKSSTRKKAVGEI